jgi:CheY-like chemotaxis protein
MKIFIVDDEEVSLYLTREVLALNGMEDIHNFLSAEEALDSLSKCNDKSLPDIILLDLNMPVMDGWEFLRALAPLGSRFKEKCSIYMLTSSLSRSGESRAKENPLVAGLIYKPINSENIRLISSPKKDSSY